MNQMIPVLILGHTRPEKVRALVSSLRPFQPPVVLFAVDGPRKNVDGDEISVNLTRKIVEEIDWKSRIHTRFRETNLGIRVAVPDAVSWAISEFGRVIVLEDDVVIGPNFLDFMSQMLKRYEDDKKVLHVNGHNIVPQQILSSVEYRFSRYTSSYAWGTWERAWTHYEDEIQLAYINRFLDLLNIQGNSISALTWFIHFRDAMSLRVDSWAYRWLASIWRIEGHCISPNSNLVAYTGFVGGTHTRRRVRWLEPPVNLTAQGKSDWSEPALNEIDSHADCWLAENVFDETLLGLIRTAVSSVALEALKRSRLK